MSDNPVKLVNRDGKIVGVDSDGEEVPIEMGDAVFDETEIGQASIEEADIDNVSLKYDIGNYSGHPILIEDVEDYTAFEIGLQSEDSDYDGLEIEMVLDGGESEDYTTYDLSGEPEVDTNATLWETDTSSFNGAQSTIFISKSIRWTYSQEFNPRTWPSRFVNVMSMGALDSTTDSLYTIEFRNDEGVELEAVVKGWK